MRPGTKFWVLTAAVFLAAVGVLISVCGVYGAALLSAAPTATPWDVAESCVLLILFVLTGLGSVLGVCDVRDAVQCRDKKR
jgi:hypothetical protein